MNLLRLLPILLCSIATAAEVPQITEAQAAKIFGPGITSGPEFVPGYPLSIKLGVPTDEKNPYQIHYLARLFTGEDGVEHSFGRSKELGDYLIVVETKSLISYIHADKAFKLVGGAYYKIRDGNPPEAIRPEEAAALLAQELKLWAGRADKK